MTGILTVWGFPHSSVGIESKCEAGDPGPIPGLGRSTGKDSDARRDWGQEEKGMTEEEMAGWHHRLDGRESE